MFMKKKLVNKAIMIIARIFYSLAAYVFFLLATPAMTRAVSQPSPVPPELSQEPGLHSPVWAFGQSSERHNALWHKGVNARDVKQRALPPKNRKEAVDTSGGIKKALKKAKKDSQGSLGMSMSNRSSAWKADPNEMRADEFRPRDCQRVVRAFAEVKANEDLGITIGPELIMRDERVGEENAHEKQPDTSLGLGMQFKYDF